MFSHTHPVCQPPKSPNDLPFGDFRPGFLVPLFRAAKYPALIVVVGDTDDREQANLKVLGIYLKELKNLLAFVTKFLQLTF